MKQRTDIFRPSAIKPEEFAFVAVENVKEDDFDAIMIRDQLEHLRWFKKDTGAKWATHEHGGSCHVCGANAWYTAVFWHEPTNQLIRTGFDCAEKFHLCSQSDVNLFKNFREACQAAEHAKAGKIKAKALLEEKGCSLAWELSLQKKDHVDWKSHDIVRDLVKKLVRRGDLSEAQWNFLSTLLQRLDNYAEIQAQRDEEKKISQHLGQVGEFVDFDGTCLFQKEWENQWGLGGITVLVDSKGNKVVVWRLLECQKGHHVSFSGKVKSHGDKDGEKQTVLAGRFRKFTNHTADEAGL